jgi:FeS assembly SUF system protein
MIMSDTDQEKMEMILDKVVDVLKTIYDPEIPVNIYDLGLVYEINANELGVVDIQMTLTSPACPVAESLPSEVEDRVQAIKEVTAANVEIVWDPPWSQDLMSEEGRLELGLF